MPWSCQFTRLRWRSICTHPSRTLSESRSSWRSDVHFRIADTFTASIAKLTADERKAVKTTALDVQLDPANPGMKFHRRDRARDKNFWSVRVNRDLRLSVDRTGSSLLLCYVG